jgi:hypothetical protein
MLEVSSAHVKRRRLGSGAIGVESRRLPTDSSSFLALCAVLDDAGVAGVAVDVFAGVSTCEAVRTSSVAGLFSALSPEIDSDAGVSGFGFDGRSSL